MHHSRTPGVPLTLIFSVILCCAARARVVYVNGSASGTTHDGTAWGTAFTSINAGLSAAVAGDEIWVAAGSYREHFSIPAGVWLYGGFAGTETSLSQRDIRANASIITGDSEYTVVRMTGTDLPSGLDGFTLTGAQADLLTTANATHVIAHNRFIGNVHGYMLLSLSAGTIFADNLVAGNYADEAIIAPSDSAQIVNNTIVGNTTATSSGVSPLVIRLISVSDPNLALVNNIIAFNSGGVDGEYATFVMRNNLVYSNGLDYYRMPDQTGFNGNRRQDPLFVNRAQGDYHLTALSPGIDHGDPTDSASGTQDADFQPRVLGRRIDIGAFESPTGLPPGLPIVRVSSDGSDINDGADWSRAKLTVQAALDAAQSPGGEVWVKAGAYTENLILPPGVSLYGSFAGTETARDQRDPARATSVLDGGKKDCVLIVTGGSGPETAIDGLTIQNGLGRGPGIGNGNGGGNGGGIYCQGASPTIRGNTFKKNSAAGGSGVYATSGSAPLISGNSFVSNTGVAVSCTAASNAVVEGNTFTGADISAVSVDGSAPVIRNNVIDAAPVAQTGTSRGITCSAGSAAIVDHNTVRNTVYAITFSGSNGSITHNTVTDNLGAGIYVNQGSPLIDGNSLIRNVAWNYGGGIAANGSSSIIRNNVVFGNAAFAQSNSSSGGGIYCSGNEVVVNNTIVGNSADQGGGLAVAYNASSGGVVCHNNIVAFNSSGIFKTSATAQTLNLAYNCVYGNYAYNYSGVSDPTGTLGSVSVDPQLADVAVGNLHIQPTSPCVDHGYNGNVASSETDMDGQPRLQGVRVDIGADESDGTQWTAIPRIVRVRPDGDDAADGSSWAAAMKTPQAALDTLNGLGGEVWMARGVYTQPITLRLLQKLLGGFAGTETDRSQRAPQANATILDGRSAGPVVSITVTATGASLDGFTIRNGNSKSGTGGIACSGAAEIAHNTITACTGYYGGGLGVLSGAPIVRNNVFRANTASQGAAIDVEAGSPTIRDNLIVGNASANGSGFYMNAQTLPAVYGNTIVANGSSTSSITLRGWTGAFSKFANNIVAFNKGAGLYENGSKSEAMHHNDVFGNTTDYYGVKPAGAGNLRVDPLFVNTATGDYRLRANSPCLDGGSDTVVLAGESDLDGNPRILGAHTDIGAYELVPLSTASMGASAHAQATAVEGVVYAGTDDGRLCAFSSPALAPVAGFPVDISATVGSAVALNSRPSVYYGQTGKAIYLTTNLGHVVKVWPDGRLAWSARPLNGATMSTPAVTSEGSVYVDLGLGTSPALNFLFKMDERSGLATYISPYLGASSAGGLADRSAAIDQRFAFVNATGQTTGGLAVLDQQNLTVRASFAPGEDALMPYEFGRSLYVATRGGHLYKVNASTMCADLAFGNLGDVAIHEAISAGPFLDARGTVWLGTASGRVWTVDGNTGTATVYLDSGKNAAVAGLLVTRNDVLAFTTADGTLVQVPFGNSEPPVTTPLGAPPTPGLAFDGLYDRFLVTTTTGRVLSVPTL